MVKGGVFVMQFKTVAAKKAVRVGKRRSLCQ
jgi:hypothetical protein